MATQTKHATCRTYMFEARAKRIAKSLNDAQHTGIGADPFKAVQVMANDSESWVIEVREDGNLAGWVML